jgi:hypothetical protein
LQSNVVYSRKNCRTIAALGSMRKCILSVKIWRIIRLIFKNLPDIFKFLTGRYFFGWAMYSVLLCVVFGSNAATAAGATLMCCLKSRNLDKFCGVVLSRVLLLSRLSSKDKNYKTTTTKIELFWTNKI